MTALSLRLSNAANAVSKLHSVTANNTWQGLGNKQILAVTNGVHMPTWVGQPMRDVYERYLGAQLDNVDARNDTDLFWERTDQIPDVDMWEAHQRQKLELMIFARNRLRHQFARHGESPGTLEELEDVLDVGALTIGFARRFATYKRASLLFSDMDRISRLLWNKERPVQIIFAGKAHPADRPGQGVIQEIFARSRSPQLRGRVFILEDYDMRVARFMVQGVDVWLNNPRRPARGVGHERHEGLRQRRREPVGPRRLVGRRLARRQRLGHRRPRDQPGRRRAGLQRLSGPLPIARAGSRAALLRPQRRRRSRRLDGRDAAIDREHDLAVLHDPDAPRVRRDDVPARGRSAGQEAGRPPNPPKPAEAGLSGRVSLALVIHNHQPVGNFGWVIEDVYEHAYSPMLHALERHPGIRLGLHYTGPLLQWLAANRPEALDQIRGLVNRGQVEIVGGAYYEPILVTLPDRDRQGQLHRMRDEIEALFGHAAARGVAGRARLGAVARLRPCRGRVRLDRPGRQPPARGIDPGRRDVDGLHHRRPRGPPDGLRHRAGPAVSHPVQAGRGSDLVSGRSPDRGRPVRRA
jgi:hypothetical protein